MSKFGRNTMIIADVSFREAQTGTPGVVITGTVEDESLSATVWISEKSAGMAHKALKLCGFDSDTQDLKELQDNPALLRGHEVEVNVTEDPQYGIKCEIVLNVAPDDQKMAAANAILKGRAKVGSPAQGIQLPTAAESPF